MGDWRSATHSMAAAAMTLCSFAATMCSSSTRRPGTALLSSSTDTRYASGGSDFDYEIDWNDSFLAAGQTMTVNGGGLAAGETMDFDGSNETNGTFRLFAGAGNDVLHGGDGNDAIYGGLG